MAAMSVGGLVSGLDTNSIIAQLTALEQAKVTREETKKENAQKALEQFKELRTRLGNLATKASALDSLTKFNTYKSTSSNEDYVTVSGKDGATSGHYEITVGQLATTQKVASNSFEAINKAMSELKNEHGDPLLAQGKTAKIKLSTSAAAQKNDITKTSVEIEISSSDTLKDIVNKINSAEGSGVKASLMTLSNGDNRLVLTAVDTGTKGFFLSEDGSSDGSVTNLLQNLGILSSDNGTEALSSGALLTKDGVAKGDTLFSELKYSNLAKEIVPGDDQIGINIDGKWFVADITGSIDDALTDLNNNLKSEGFKVRVELNNSGEMVLKNGSIKTSPTDPTDFADKEDFDLYVKDAKLVIGKFETDTTDPTNPEIKLVDGSTKRDLGKFTQQNTFGNVINYAQNAFYTLDGTAITSQSNDDDKIVPGTVFSLKKTTEKLDIPVKVSLELDKDAIADSITALVEEFNSLMAFIDENAKATVTEKVDKTTGKKTTVREVGCFTGDSNISSLQDNLKRMMTGLMGELSHPQTIEGKNGKEPNPEYTGFYTVYSSSASLGITTQRDGTITVDKDKLLKALDKDIEGVRRLFTANSFTDTPGYVVGNFTKNSTTGVYEIDPVTGQVNLKGHPGEYLKTTRVANIITLENGISFELPETVDPSAGKVTATFVRGIASQMTNFVELAKTFKDGYYDTSEKTYQDRIDSMQKRIDDLQARVDRYNDRITKQFAALETNISNLQSQTANMLSALSTVSYSSSKK